MRAWIFQQINVNRIKIIKSLKVYKSKINSSKKEYNLPFQNPSMQSYQLHIVSQQLKRRHPYLQPPFKARYDPTEVYKSVFDRTLPKLMEILLTQDLQPERYVSALITLNEIASDETEKSKMIDLGFVGLASAYCHCKIVSIRREATLFLGLLLSTPQGLSKMQNEAFTALKNLLFDEQLQVRNAVSWAISRVSLSRQGAQILCKQEIMTQIVASFLKYSQKQVQEEQYFLIYLLQSFKHLLAYDLGIEFGLGTGLTRRLKVLTSTKAFAQDNNTKIHYLSLGALSNIAMNLKGKQECVDQQVIAFTEKFLQSSNIIQVANEVTLIMFTAIHLTGKKQCIYGKNGKITTNIIVKLIKLLQKDPKTCNNISEQIKIDIRQTLKIIAEQRDGFLAIADYMSRQTTINHIEDIFGPKIIIALAELLPKVKDVQDPPTLPSNKISEYKVYAKTINYFINKEPVSVSSEPQSQTALEIALNQCVDLSVKLIMFICYRGDKILQDGIVASLLKMTKAHPYSRQILKQFVQQHGQKQHKISKTSVSSELRHFVELAKSIGVSFE